MGRIGKESPASNTKTTSVMIEPQSAHPCIEPHSAAYFLLSVRCVADVVAVVSASLPALAAPLVKKSVPGHARAVMHCNAMRVERPQSSVACCR